MTRFPAYLFFIFLGISVFCIKYARFACETFGVVACQGKCRKCVYLARPIRYCLVAEYTTHIHVSFRKKTCRAEMADAFLSSIILFEKIYLHIKIERVCFSFFFFCKLRASYVCLVMQRNVINQKEPLVSTCF